LEERRGFTNYHFLITAQAITIIVSRKRFDRQTMSRNSIREKSQRPALREQKLMEGNKMFSHGPWNVWILSTLLPFPTKGN
jgi:hypothetical protein